MPRGQGRNAGHNHVLAAIADAIHANSTYKGAGKANKGGGAKGQWQQQDGRNCPSCNDYNFGFRAVCRQCGTRLPPAQTAGDGAKGQRSAWSKGAGKGPGTASAWSGKGGQEGAASAAMHGAPGPAPTPAAAKPGGATEEEEPRDPAERVREIRSEEEKLRRARSQFVDNNPRMVATIDKELEHLSAERERLQPLEVNLQAAAGRTANARAALAKAKEKRTQAAKELRTQIEAFKSAEKEVAEAEAKLLAAEAAAQVAAALQQIANVLGAITTATAGAAPTGAEGKTGEAAEQTQAGGDGGGINGKGSGCHPVFAVCGSTDAKSRRTLPLPQEPAALVGGAADDGAHVQSGGCDGNELFAGGTVAGEVSMGNAGPSGGDDGEELLAQAAAVLGDEDSQL